LASEAEGFGARGVGVTEVFVSDFAEEGEIGGFVDEAGDSVGYGIEDCLGGHERAGHDDSGEVSSFAELLDELESVESRDAKVEEDEIKGFGGEDILSDPSVFRTLDLQAV